MLADAPDAEAAKYDRFIRGLAGGNKKQKGILEVTRVCLACSLHPDSKNRSPKTTDSCCLGRRTKDGRSSCAARTWSMPNISRSPAIWTKAARYDASPPFL
ncbi:hypothetical protein BKA82DRAFT_178649 [Pisolithus tinctorius]|uniref:Uncharacterized protein n=1 Tax=Pisolithus tinctorius Marx 270 TaxID=870435 RepID=A0A0C3PZ27_PISTI|nr:hypothetical protein BKA82DRAFT_178649 [Pisolithus tinctorius]KIO14584.1 hypothetical protein M404DRAFT_178649 [Pisolithus tinctorius Marx 270]